MTRCLVTGATGFIGPRLVSALQDRGFEVACLVRPTAHARPLEELGATMVLGDVTQPESLPPALAGIDVVYHLAGRTLAPSYAEFARVNEQGTASIAAACAVQPQPPVLVVASSLAAAGPSTAERPLTEDDPPEPISNYGRSKLAGELAAREWAAEVPLSIVRPPVVFGPADHMGLNLARAIQKTGLHFVHRPGLPLSLVHVDDLVQALLLVAEQGERVDPTSPRGEGIYYAADPALSSYTEMGQMLAAALGRHLRVVRVRRWALGTAAFCSEGWARIRRTPAVLNFDKLREATATGWTASPVKLVNQLGFQPRLSLAEGYRETVEWYRAEKWL